MLVVERRVPWLDLHVEDTQVRCIVDEAMPRFLVDHDQALCHRRRRSGHPYADGDEEGPSDKLSATSTVQGGREVAPCKSQGDLPA